MTRQDAFKRLMLGVSADHRDYQQLETLLQSQFAAALRHDGAALTAIGEQVLTLVEAMDARRQERVTVAGLLLGRKPVSMGAVIASLSGKPRATLEAWWQRLEALVNECKALNARNGQLMASQFEIMQRVLHGESDTYVPD
ncbi:flagellar protein FlgN [Jeongeupia naejangsanensis]|uniref:Flagellar protein FlgN n=1 Tax=Jeongeupia naejangsanensis TaxID=613195 RepID=A0ABS2BGG7_9NEIS|nr:flagellar protein FlgN [Jeongeupia naejangsanensis]MBM3114707.1 flagellar protein FlgN [Jeongeupia naejangsanensis]